MNEIMTPPPWKPLSIDTDETVVMPRDFESILRGARDVWWNGCIAKAANRVQGPTVGYTVVVTLKNTKIRPVILIKC